MGETYSTAVFLNCDGVLIYDNSPLAQASGSAGLIGLTVADAQNSRNGLHLFRGVLFAGGQNVRCE
jgi:hypothetical protein